MQRIVAIALMLVNCSAFAQWQYTVANMTEMDDRPTTQAHVISDGSLDLPFPYAGKNEAQLSVRLHPKMGLDVLFKIEKGQLVCSRIDVCELVIKFDDGKPEYYKATAPADHKTNVLFVLSASRFVERAKKAKKILVQPTIYQAGSPVLTFSTPGGLQWPYKGP